MSKSILLVDDDVTNLEILETILEEEDYNVKSLQSGKECLDYMETNKPDLILMDVMLQDTLGTDVCNKIKSNPKNADVIIILLSGIKVKPEDYIFGLEVGADDYISRPFNTKQILVKIKAVFRLKESIVKSRESNHEPFDKKNTENTAQIYQQQLLKIAYPEEFKRKVNEYTEILTTAVHQRFYKTAENNSSNIKNFAMELGFLKAEARDIVDIHKEVLKYCLTQDTAKRAFLFKEESRIVLVEILGYLLNYYRNKI